MKTLVVFFLALLVSPADATEMPELSFGSARIEPSPLSLLESAKQRLPPIFSDSGKPVAAVRRKLISRMPIVRPRPGVEDRMRIKTPNPDIEYKLLVKEPEIESEKKNEP